MVSLSRLFRREGRPLSVYPSLFKKAYSVSRHLAEGGSGALPGGPPLVPYYLPGLNPHTEFSDNQCMRKVLSCFILLFLLSLSGTYGQSDEVLAIGSEDVYIEQGMEDDKGYHLWIKKEENLGSVLLTESTADPEKKNDSFALRDPEYNPVNGDELRMLNGEFLDPENELYSLIDSTPEEDAAFGEAFHIFIPFRVVYGYPWSRSGEINVINGTWLNIRAFENPYGDYRGAFKDNPFRLKVIEKKPEPPETEPEAEAEPEEVNEDNYMKETVDDFREIAEKGKGEAILSLGKDEIVEEIREIISKAEGETLDLVLALDTTRSMRDDVPFLRKNLVTVLKEETERFDSFRFGMIYYRDYMEAYLTKKIPFRDSLDGVQVALNALNVRGGRDIPEAVYEALYGAIHSFPWAAEARLIILIGDAPPHDRPRGKVTREMVFQDAAAEGIRINALILPQ